MMHSRLPDGINEYSQISRTLAVGRQVDQVHGSLLEACQDVKQALLREDSVRRSTPAEPEPEPQRLCRRCGEAMRRFTARSNGRPYVKCDKCGHFYAERDTRIPACYCGFPAKLRTAYTEKNYGRKFRGCPKTVSGHNQCKFFRWASDI
jgi:hypothetical protein